MTDTRSRHVEDTRWGWCQGCADDWPCDGYRADKAEALVAGLEANYHAAAQGRAIEKARADKAEAERDELRGRLLLLGPPTEPLSYNQVKAAMERVEEVIAHPHRERADKAEAALAEWKGLVVDRDYDLKRARADAKTLAEALRHIAMECESEALMRDAACAALAAHKEATE